jgi:FkbM family methyltransferase
MLKQKFKKILSLLLLKIRYPNLLIIGGPNWLSIFFARIKPVKGVYSQDGQDTVISGLITKGFLQFDAKIIIDIGANHPIIMSNSHHFESNFGFRVIAIDPLAEMGAEWSLLRPGADFLCCAVGDSSGVAQLDAAIGMGGDSMFSSIKGSSVKHVQNGSKPRQVKVETITNILDRLGIAVVDILSLDIEGYELNALRGIDFSRISFGVILVENNNDETLSGNSDIRRLLARNGYVLMARFWNLDDLFINRSLLTGSDFPVNIFDCQDT